MARSGALPALIEAHFCRRRNVEYPPPGDRGVGPAPRRAINAVTVAVAGISTAAARHHRGGGAGASSRSRGSASLRNIPSSKPRPALPEIMTETPRQWRAGCGGRWRHRQRAKSSTKPLPAARRRRGRPACMWPRRIMRLRWRFMARATPTSSFPASSRHHYAAAEKRAYRK